MTNLSADNCATLIRIYGNRHEISDAIGADLDTLRAIVDVMVLRINATPTMFQLQ